MFIKGALSGAGDGDGDDGRRDVGFVDGLVNYVQCPPYVELRWLRHARRAEIEQRQQHQVAQHARWQKFGFVLWRKSRVSENLDVTRVYISIVGFKSSQLAAPFYACYES